MEEIEKILSNEGFVFYTSCYCGGVFTKKYKKGLWRINICPRNGTFFLIHANVSLVGKRIKDFNEIFKKHIQDTTSPLYKEA